MKMGTNHICMGKVIKNKRIFAKIYILKKALKTLNISLTKLTNSANITPRKRGFCNCLYLK